MDVVPERTRPNAIPPPKDQRLSQAARQTRAIERVSDRTIVSGKIVRTEKAVSRSGELRQAGCEEKECAEAEADRQEVPGLTVESRLKQTVRKAGVCS